jgi:nucleoside-diphosphate-sugar epimerase
MSRKPDIRLAQAALGFVPRITWQEGLPETIAWFSEAISGRPAEAVR